MLEIITPPIMESLTLDEAKSYARITSTREDDLIASLIASATNIVERQTGRSLITRTLRYSFDLSPDDCTRHSAGRPVVYLPGAPLQSVSSVTYTDPAGVTQTLDPTAYFVLPGEARPSIELATIPATAAKPRAWACTYVAGYGEQEDVPAPLKIAMRLLVREFHKNREINVDAKTVALPIGVDRLLALYTYNLVPR